MIPCLDRKLWRDLNRLKGQAIAVSLVMGCGLAMMVMARSLIYSLDRPARNTTRPTALAKCSPT